MGRYVTKEPSDDRRDFVFLRHVYDCLNDYFCDRLAKGIRGPVVAGDVFEALKDIPVYDVEGVVRCKRCVHGFPVKSPDGTDLVVCTNGFACDGIGHAPDFYCAEGEEK